jgi:hypothetical protein
MYEYFDRDIHKTIQWFTKKNKMFDNFGGSCAPYEFIQGHTPEDLHKLLNNLLS